MRLLLDADASRLVTNSGRLIPFQLRANCFRVRDQRVSFYIMRGARRLACRRMGQARGPAQIRQERPTGPQAALQCRSQSQPRKHVRRPMRQKHDPGYGDASAQGPCEPLPSREIARNRRRHRRYVNGVSGWKCIICFSGDGYPVTAPMNAPIGSLLVHQRLESVR
ncbi:MAG: hypothetical protein V7604_5108 [Hyphomicrobiales bacterium]